MLTMFIKANFEQKCVSVIQLVLHAVVVVYMYSVTACINRSQLVTERVLGTAGQQYRDAADVRQVDLPQGEYDGDIVNWV